MSDTMVSISVSSSGTDLDEVINKRKEYENKVKAVEDLYEALEDAVDLLTEAGYSTLEHRAALAKARGEV